MYKMKDVCQMTGLTEKAIRLYVEQKLVEPEIEDGVHRKSYFFHENDIERLKDIAALRTDGFALADIKMMLEDPTNIYYSRVYIDRMWILEEKVQRLLFFTNVHTVRRSVHWLWRKIWNKPTNLNTLLIILSYTQIIGIVIGKNMIFLDFLNKKFMSHEFLGYFTRKFSESSNKP